MIAQIHLLTEFELGFCVCIAYAGGLLTGMLIMIVDRKGATHGSE